MARAGDQCVRVTPHGKLGDKKCDGLFFGDGVVYQVYSPDQILRRQTLTKIKTNLAGAVAEWGPDLKEWVFVYNTRAGVAAAVPAMLNQQQRLYPTVKIRPLSDDDLWKIVRDLPIADRVELLGPPPPLLERAGDRGADHADGGRRARRDRHCCPPPKSGDVARAPSTGHDVSARLSGDVGAHSRAGAPLSTHPSLRGGTYALRGGRRAGDQPRDERAGSALRVRLPEHASICARAAAGFGSNAYAVREQSVNRCLSPSSRNLGSYPTGCH